MMFEVVVICFNILRVRLNLRGDHPLNLLPCLAEHPVCYRSLGFLFFKTIWNLLYTLHKLMTLMNSKEGQDTDSKLFERLVFSGQRVTQCFKIARALSHEEGISSIFYNLLTHNQKLWYVQIMFMLHFLIVIVFRFITWCIYVHFCPQLIFVMKLYYT